MFLNQFIKNKKLFSTCTIIKSKYKPFETDSPTAKLLEASLKHVEQESWTINALRRGCIDLDLPEHCHRLAENGEVDLINYFVRKSTIDMTNEMQKLDLNQMRVTQKIRKACSIRLELLQPYIDTWQDALKVMAKPQNVPASLLNLSELIDEMWYLAGDRSFDMNWYSKRALLTGVYTSTEWYMTQDKSPNFVDTYNFLDRRLQDVGTIGKTASDIKGTAEFFKKTVQGIIESKSGMKF